MTALPITAQVDQATMALIDQAARARGLSREQFAAEAVGQAARREGALEAAVAAGIASADRGDLVPHDEVMAELDGMIAKHQARCG